MGVPRWSMTRRPVTKHRHDRLQLGLTCGVRRRGQHNGLTADRQNRRCPKGQKHEDGSCKDPSWCHTNALTSLFRHVMPSASE
jgi:hypothetical protein